MIGKAMLLSEMCPGPDWEEDFHDWYDTEHIPVRTSIEGFTGAQRYKAIDDDNYLVVYDFDSLNVLQKPEYRMLKDEPSERTKWMLENVTNFTRHIGREIGRTEEVEQAVLNAPVIFIAMFDVPKEDQKEFDDWMVKDHMPLLLECDDWMGIRRFDLSVSGPVPFTRLAIHYLASEAALSSPERAAARDTEWRKKLGAEKEWMSKGYYKKFQIFGGRHD